MTESEKKGFDVLVVGRYFCDQVFTQLPEFPRLGHEVYSREFHLVPGGVFTPAVTLTRLGLRAAWPCEFGSDPFSQYVKNEALKAGVDSAFFSQSDQPSLRITVAFSFGKERAFLSYTDPLPVIPYAEIIRHTSPKWVYNTHLMTGEAQEKITCAAREVGTRVYMDCQAHHTTISYPDTSVALGRVDVFSPNRAEALALTGEKNIESALDKLRALTEIVIIKDGANGSLCGYPGGIIRTPAMEVEVVDTTGAGDNFNCGFIYGHVKGYSLEGSLRIGNICGGLSVEVVGGGNDHINPHEIVQRLENYKVI